MRIRQACHLGCHPRLIDLSHRRLAEAIAHHPPGRDSETAVIIVGRGSYDASASEEMFRLVELRRSRMRAFDVRAAFLAMAQPTFDDVAAAIRDKAVRDKAIRDIPCRTVFVQPHFLFTGELLERLRRRVDEIDHEQSGIQHWHLTAHLGVAGELVEAVTDRFAQAPHR
jgi:sirohydrochlorin cobaltochelatase